MRKIIISFFVFALCFCITGCKEEKVEEKPKNEPLKIQTWHKNYTDNLKDQEVLLPTLKSPLINISTMIKIGEKEIDLTKASVKEFCDASGLTVKSGMKKDKEDESFCFYGTGFSDDKDTLYAECTFNGGLINEIQGLEQLKVKGILLSKLSLKNPDKFALGCGLAIGMGKEEVELLLGEGEKKDSFTYYNGDNCVIALTYEEIENAPFVKDIYIIMR